jgi:hypothetical protein
VTYVGALPADDCDDADATAFPGATEALDGADQDCDGLVDEGTTAFDDDGDCTCEVEPCSGSIDPSCAVVVGGDCADDDALVSPLVPDDPDRCTSTTTATGSTGPSTTACSSTRSTATTPTTG